MADDYNPQSFWGERFLKHGHTGEVDNLLYAYDQPQRLRAIDRALARAKISINSDTKILDIGCGTGDLIGALMEHGQPEINGIDISDETISYAQKRFAANTKVRLFCTRVEDMDFLSNSFDLAVGINVLQHINDEQAFSKAVDSVIRVVKVGGHILAMDFSPVRVANRKPAPYLIVRSRQEYIDAFEKSGCRFISEFGLPRLGVRLYRTTERTIGRLVRRLLNDKARVTEETTLKSEPAPPLRLPRLYRMRVILLALTKPFDYLLVPFPARYTDMRILVFKKRS